MEFSFKIIDIDKKSRARVGIIETPHGAIKTPAFVPVGTMASIKALDPDDLERIGAQLVLTNTYHLHLRPGENLIRNLGGLHDFMGWGGPIITDSGGFQAFSLGFGLEHQVGKIGNIFPKEGRGNQKTEKKEKLAHIDEEGVTFKSPYDGSIDKLTPEKSIRIQEKLGADIILALDECTSPLSDYDYTKKAMHRTHRWAARCLKAHTNNGQALFGIIQGGKYKLLREESAAYITKLDFDGIAIGGSLGKSKKDMHKILDWCISLLPKDKPRHLLGIGAIEDLFECAARGIDSFDCVMPTRMARSGYLLLTPANGGSRKNKYRESIKKAKYRKDPEPFDPGCGCYSCKHFTGSYLRHLFVSKELLFYRLATIHNLHLILRLMRSIRRSILKKQFAILKKEWLG